MVLVMHWVVAPQQLPVFDGCFGVLVYRTRRNMQTAQVTRIVGGIFGGILFFPY